mmetsp:Transcript_99869/g.223848  ORF Transcript_99869/g.223848 Transcript_99869/m.223848 type:complete len:81 (+) Transcript_99869:338-580(+)
MVEMICFGLVMEALANTADSVLAFLLYWAAMSACYVTMDVVVYIWWERKMFEPLVADLIAINRAALEARALLKAGLFRSL